MPALFESATYFLVDKHRVGGYCTFSLKEAANGKKERTKNILPELP
jgi:hypothetical protein